LRPRIALVPKFHFHKPGLPVETRLCHNQFRFRFVKCAVYSPSPTALLEIDSGAQSR